MYIGYFHLTLVEEEAKPRGVFATIGLLLIGVFIANADGTLVTTTYTTISSEFGDFGNAAWLSTSYTLATCAVQAAVAKLSDIYGRKAVLLASYACFAVGSVLTGIAQSMWQAIVGRIVSGVGAAGMVVIVSVLITDLVPLIEVATWRSYVNVVATLGRSIGGPIGGFLADTVGWRWSFIGQGPLILLAIILVSFRLPSHTSAELPQPKGQPSALRRIDFIGAFLLAVTTVTSLGALGLGGQGLQWSHPIILGLSTSSAFLGSLFVLWEVKYAFEPIFPPSLAIQRDVASAYAIMVLQVSSQVSMMFSIPLHFRVTANASNTTAGAHLFPAVLGNAAGGLLAGFLIKRTGRYKSFAILAAACSITTHVLLVLRWHGRVSVWESLEIVPGGFGTGVVASAMFVALTSAVKQRDIAVSVGGMYLASAGGMLAGVAVSSSVQLSSLRKLLVQRVAGPGSEGIISSVISDVSSIPSLPAPLQRIVIESYVTSLGYSHKVSLSFATLALLIAITIREHPLR